MDGRDFGVLYESLFSRSEVSDLVLSDGPDGVNAQIALRSGGQEVEATILDTGSGVHFWRRLSDATIDVACPVQLGLEVQRFLLGPRVDLDSDQLVLGCSELDVDLVGNVTVQTESYVALSHPLRLRVRNEERGTLSVRWPSVTHPWAPFRVTSAAGPLRLSETLRGDTLRKMLLMFRKQRTRRESTLTNSRWSPQQLRDRDDLISLSLRHGVLSKVGGLDVIEFSSDFDSLKTLIEGSPTLSPAARTFLEEYLGQEQANRLI